MEDLVYRELTHILKKNGVQAKEPLSRHTTFRIGGPADYFVVPSGVEELKETVSFCRREKLPYVILGNGSNLLVSDAGFRGVVIHYESDGTIRLRQEENVAFLSGGADLLLSKITAYAAKEGLCGLEFASGIPGSLGGAVVMNAGAYGSEIADFLTGVEVLDGSGTVLFLPKEELGYGYRTSILQDGRYVVLGAEFALRKGDPEQIRSQMQANLAKRKEKQPLEYPSAGSTFKRPAGGYAGKLIMEAGLRGLQVGGARVSDKHCGFIINTGRATAEDVLRLMRLVQDRVKAQTGILLEPEVKLLGEFPEIRSKERENERCGLS